MNVHYIITYDTSTVGIISCVPAGAEYPAECVIEGTNTAILHKLEEITGRIQDWSDNHWVDQGYNFVHKGDRPGPYWVWDLDTKTYEFDSVTFWEHVRQERTKRLYMSDWTQFDDCPLSDSQKEEWKSYRAALRDIPNGFENVQSFNAIAWPTPPNDEIIKVTVW